MIIKLGIINDRTTKLKQKKSGNKNRKFFSKLSTNVYLSISEAPQIVRTDNLGLIRVVKGSTVTIKCKVTGFPPPKVLFKWIVVKFSFFCNILPNPYSKMICW